MEDRGDVLNGLSRYVRCDLPLRSVVHRPCFGHRRSPAAHGWYRDGDDYVRLHCRYLLQDALIDSSYNQFVTINLSHSFHRFGTVCKKG